MPRIYIPDVSLHVHHRGNNRMDIFCDDDERDLFLRMLQGAADRHSLAVHAFVIMTTHFHMIATPANELSLARTMKQIGERYSRFFNRKYGRTGTIWEKRYHGKHILDEKYWLTCLRYVEQNPVRAGMVTAADAYPWSSYGFHANGRGLEWLVPHAEYLKLGATSQERQAAYRAICAERLPETDLVCVRHSWTTPASVALAAV